MNTHGVTRSPLKPSIPLGRIDDFKQGQFLCFRLLQLVNVRAGANETHNIPIAVRYRRMSDSASPFLYELRLRRDAGPYSSALA